jgi:hypothetical protein
MFGQITASTQSLARDRQRATVTFYSHFLLFSSKLSTKDKSMRKKIHCGRVPMLVLLSLSVLGGVHGQDVPAKNAESGEVQALKQELAEQKKVIEELRLLLLDQKKEIDEVRRQQASVSDAPAAPSPGIALIASAATIVPPEPAPKPTPLVPPPVPQAASAKPPSDVPATQLSDSITLINGKVRIGATVYADWADYVKSGFGPQFLTQINQEGPGNNGSNSFDVSRAYVNLYYSPNDNITVRITPNIYRQIAGGITADKIGAVTALPASADQNLTFRLKYGYLDWKNLFKGSAKGVVLTIGQLQNPLVDWEENLWSYRFVSLVPWNYLSLSSTQTGITLHGPIQSNGKTYLDFSAGIMTQASFHAYEQSEKKQLMARATLYPLGSTGNYQGLALTGFYDYGYTNVPPDTRSLPVYRGVAMVHYATKNNSSNIGFEYDFGRNAFSAGNLFSGSGPLDQFSLGTTVYANMDNVAKALLGTDRTKQQGFNVFGHLQLGKSPFQLFGWFQTFQPNTEISKNPDDFNRYIFGVNYRVNRSMRFAVDTQNLVFTHSQYTMPAADVKPFSNSLANANPNGIANVVPDKLRALFVNMEFSF